MKSIDVPIYQRQNSLKSEEKKDGLLKRIYNKVPYFDLSFGVLAFLFARTIILDSLMPFGFIFFSIFFFQKEKKMIGLQRAVFILLGVSLGYISQLGLYSIKYLAAIIILIATIKNKEVINDFRYSLLATLSFLICQLPQLIFASSTVEFISSSSEVLLVFLITIMAIRILPDVLIYLEDKDEGVIVRIVLASFVVALFFSGVPIEIFGDINIVRLIASYLIMLAAFVSGPNLATLLGVSLGFIYSIVNLSPYPLIGNYALAGLISGNFKNQKKLGVISGFIISNLIYVIFINNSDYITVLMREGMLAGLVFLLTPKKLIPSLDFLKKDKLRSERIEDKKWGDYLSYRIENFSKIFEELFDSFSGGIVVNKKDEVENVGTFMDLLTDKVCKGCDLYSSCWQKSFYDTYSSLFNLLNLAETKGEVTLGDLDKVMSINCSQKIKLSTNINEFIKMHELNSYWRSRLDNSEKVLLDQLSGMSNIINDLSNEINLDIKLDNDIKERVCCILENNGFIIKEVLASNYDDEDLELTIRKISCNGNDRCIKKMVPLLNSKLNLNLERTWNECGAELGKTNCVCRLAPASRYKFEGGVSTLSSSKEGVSGDHYTFFNQKNRRFVAILSDGMGVGAKAHKESKAAVSLLKKMLEAGLDYEFALHTVNSTLCLRSSEDTFATVDLFSVDSKTGRGEFVKVGSASSFIKRGSDISMIKSTSLPIGILNKVDIEPNSLQLQDKDMIIMMSDGVLDTNDNLTIKEEWILKILKNNLINDPQSLAQYILDKAASEGNNNSDDMTVLVIKVDKC
ncbi:stage II sporulation protein E [Halonatronum saccharophilum]|uniref:stage II sporulation protein E n=1 Tax=Halonatronum saccharophilum TaxID=150060 RepID=UPI00047FD73A|nr:stage II sporulation protein E [Halonatronum saccharophilum]